MIPFPTENAHAEIRRMVRGKLIARGVAAYHNGEPAPALRECPWWLASCVMTREVWERGAGLPTELRAWRREARKNAEAATDRHVRIRYDEAGLMALIQRDASTYSDHEHRAVQWVMVIAGERHNGPGREEMAQTLGVDISGLTPIEAACRIAAARG